MSFVYYEYTDRRIQKFRDSVDGRNPANNLSLVVYFIFTGFYTSKRWFFGISEPSTVTVGWLFAYICSYSSIRCLLACGSSFTRKKPAFFSTSDSDRSFFDFVGAFPGFVTRMEH